MAQVNFERKELKKLKSQYRLIRDVLAGETAIKSARQEYLPVPNSCDISDRNNQRYSEYVQRAVFYNATRRTLNGLVGQLFLTSPVIEIPNILDPILTDINGLGTNFEQLAQGLSKLAIAYSRAGLFIDYPATEGEISKADLDSGSIRPTISVIDPVNIINWRVYKAGAVQILSLVVIKEDYIVSDDGFAIETATQYRVLRLVDGLYEIQIYRLNKGKHEVAEVYKPTDYHGNRLTRIPFVFVGGKDNDPEPDEPEFYDLASLNIAHYRNSADYEESVFLVGQPTPVFAGLTQEWVDTVLNGSVELGSRGGVPLPEGASAFLLQANANGLAKEAMDSKERQMIALGARLIENKDVQITATQASLESASANSSLATVGKNVSQGLSEALRWAGVFVGDFVDDEIYCELNTDFELALLSAEDRNVSIEAWQKGAIAFSEMRESLRKTKLAFMDDEEAKETIDNENANKMLGFGNFGE